MSELILWRRVDAPGMDACRLSSGDAGSELLGTAVGRHAGMPSALEYRVTCNGSWHTLHATLRGWIGPNTVSFAISRTPSGVWQLNGMEVAGLDGCVDLDLGFTPATNLLPIRRLDLEPHQSSDVVAAWLDVSAGTLRRLEQRYERRSVSRYWYEAPSFGYTALLAVRPPGFVSNYPGLWEEET